MLLHLQLFLLLALLKPLLINSQETHSPFYDQKRAEIPLLNRAQISDYQGNINVDARKIIAPIMSPFMDMFDVMQQNVRARAYAEKATREREESPLSTSRSIFEMIERLQRPTTTTTPQPPLLERLLRPYIEPWQKQINEFSKDVAGFLPTTTTLPKITSTSKENLFEKSLKFLFPSFQQDKITTTTPIPKLFDTSMIENLLFSRQKREFHSRKKRQTDMQPLSNLGVLSTFKELDEPTLEQANPFTLNPLMSLFTTPKPFVELPHLEKPIILDLFSPTFTLPHIQYKLQDPFFNPLFPYRRSKLFDLLAGGEAVRVLG